MSGELESYGEKRENRFTLSKGGLARKNYMHNPYNAVRVMWESNELLPNESKQKWLAFRLHELDLVKESYMMLTAVPKSRYEKISEINRYRMIETDYNYQRYLSEILFCTGNHVSKVS